MTIVFESPKTYIFEDEGKQYVFQKEEKTYTFATSPVGYTGAQGIAGTSLGSLFVRDNQYTEGSPLRILENVRTIIPNDALHVASIFTYRPAGKVWWNPSTLKFVPDALGDAFHVRIEITMKPTINNRQVAIDINNGVIPISNAIYKLENGAGVAEKHSFLLHFGVSTNLLTNGGTIGITPKCDMDIYQISFFIEKTQGS